MIKKISLALSSALVIVLSTPFSSILAAPPVSYNHPPFDPDKSLPNSQKTIPVPNDPSPGPAYPTKRQYLCANWKYQGPPRPNPAFVHFMQLDQLHRLETGSGQKIAVIDTGVTPNGRYKDLISGGDYISSDGGLYDCVGHGSLVAGLIGGTKSPKDDFVGVAPDAQIISIRASNQNKIYQYNTDNHVSDEEMNAHPLGGLNDLAHAITHATNMGATVINISLAECTDTFNPPNTIELKNALLYAVQIKHVVIVTAAGNTTEERGCKSNPDFDPSHPADVRNWTGLQNLSFPSYYQPLVLSVASTTDAGEPLNTSMVGPWVGVAAPGYKITSFNRDHSAGQPLFIDTSFDPESNKTGPISGTSFAAPLVAGLAALIKERYPELSALQVINRIQATAHHPSGGVNNYVGFGVVDAKAALTANVPVNVPFSPPGLPDSLLPPPPPPAPVDYTARNISLFIAGGAFLCVVLVGISVFLRRKNT